METDTLWLQIDAPGGCTCFTISSDNSHHIQVNVYHDTYCPADSLYFSVTGAWHYIPSCGFTRSPILIEVVKVDTMVECITIEPCGALLPLTWTRIVAEEKEGKMIGSIEATMTDETETLVLTGSYNGITFSPIRYYSVTKTTVHILFEEPVVYDYLQLIGIDKNGEPSHSPIFEVNRAPVKQKIYFDILGRRIPPTYQPPFWYHSR